MEKVYSTNGEYFTHEELDDAAAAAIDDSYALPGDILTIFAGSPVAHLTVKNVQEIKIKLLDTKGAWEIVQ